MASCEWTPASQRGQAFQREDAALDNTAVRDPATAGVKRAGGCCVPAAGPASGGVKRRAGSPHTLHCLLLFAAAPLACAAGAFTCTVQDALNGIGLSGSLSLQSIFFAMPVRVA